jgi:hypothetical protein
MYSKLERMLVMFLIMFLLLSPLLVFPVESSSTSRLYPTDDSWVEAEYPNGNHGSETSLRVKSDSRTRRSYLKFDLGSIPNGKTLTSVKLYLYCNYMDFNPTVEIYVNETGDNWYESSITWYNAPAVGPGITSISVGETGQYYCWDITPYGQTQYSGDKILSIVVKLLLDDPTKNNPNLARYFASREYSGTTQDPYLEIIYEDTQPTALFTYEPTYPVANDTVTFNASESYDPDGYIATYTWDFGDGNITTVTTPVIEHVYTMYDNYTVTLTVMDNDGLNGLCTQVVEVVDPKILSVSLPEGIYVKQHTGDTWIDEGWLLNQTGNSWSFTVKISDTSRCLRSDDTHLVVALNDAAYNNLQSLTINGTSIPKTAFQYGGPKPYDIQYWPWGCVYPTWFNDTYINVGTILPKGYKILTVSVTFSNATGARMHFDAYGHCCYPLSWNHVSWSPHSQDSTVLYQAAPSPLSVSITPTSAVLDLGQHVTFTSSVSGGSSPYTYQWYLNGAAVGGATSSSWAFTPASTGSYLIHLNVTDSLSKKAKSNVASVTVNPALSVSIQPFTSIITLGESVGFTSTVSGGTSPFAYKWYVNDSEVSGATSPSWTFTPTSTGYYQVCLKVTDGASATTLSNEAEVTVCAKTYNLTITTNAGGTTNPAPGIHTYNNGTNVGVTAIPDTNYKFVYWELNGSNVGSGNPIAVLMDNNYQLKAYFALITYTLTITSTTGGTTNPTPGTYTYPSGSYADVAALPSANYFLDHWVLDGSPAGSANPISVLMNNNRTLHAVFSLINYTLTITASAGGTTNPTPGTYVYASGSSAPVSAIPNVNYKFVKWLLDGNDVGSANPYSVYMDGNHTLQAVFQQLTYRLTILSSTGGNTDPAAGTYTYVNGTYASVTALPDGSYRLDYWLLDGNPAGSTNPISVLMTDDHTLQAVFAENHTLEITASAGGTTNPQPGTYTYLTPTDVTVTAIPSTNYRFDHWMYDDSNIGSANPVIVHVGSNHTLHAVFVLITYTLKIETTTGGTTSPTPETYTHNVDSTVQVTALPNTNYYLDHWELDTVNVGSANPYSVSMTQNHTLKAVFTSTPPAFSVSISPLSASIHVGQSVVFTSTVTGGTAPYSYQWYLDNAPVSGATSASWTYTPASASVHYVKLKLTDSEDNVVESDYALITVTDTVPVGGYSVSLTKPTRTAQLASYIMIVALFGAILSLAKRKRK